MGEKITEYKNKFQKDKYDRISVLVPKNEKEIIKEYADSEGDSLNGFIYKAINEKINRINNRG